MKSLIAYFSQEGHKTQTVAEKLTKLINSDIFQICTIEPYPTEYNALMRIAKFEYEENKKPEIMNPFETLDRYNPIFIGFPIWFRSYPRAVASFLESFDLKDKTVISFCTNEEGEFAMADMELDKLASKMGFKHIKGISIKSKDVETCDVALEKWLRTLNI